jgi:hypothetical protein
LCFLVTENFTFDIFVFALCPTVSAVHVILSVHVCCKGHVLRVVEI